MSKRSVLKVYLKVTFTVLQVNSVANNKSSKPTSVVGTKPQKLSEQPVESANPPPSQALKSENVIQTPSVKQNGVKDEDEDIFSPLRESMLCKNRC